MTTGEMPELAALIARAWNAADPEPVAGDVARFRRRFTDLHFVRTAP